MKRTKRFKKLRTNIVIIMLIFYCVIFIRQQLVLNDINETKAEMKNRIEQLIRETDDSQELLGEMETPEYMERIAREKLGMVKPDEIKFFIPKNDLTDEQIED